MCTDYRKLKQKHKQTKNYKPINQNANYDYQNAKPKTIENSTIYKLGMRKIINSSTHIIEYQNMKNRLYLKKN